jgi:hypothetical protein
MKLNVVVEDSADSGGNYAFRHLLFRSLSRDVREVLASPESLTLHAAKGNGKVVDMLARNGSRYLNETACPILVLLDGDKVRRLLGIDARACRTQVHGSFLSHVRKACAGVDADRVELCLLEANMESVLSVCLSIHPVPYEGKLHSPLAREAIINGFLASTSQSDRFERLKSDLPSFGRLVHRIEHHVREHATAPSAGA